MKVKVCVIGIGGIGLHHANSCAKAGYSLIGIDIIEIENIGFPVYKNFSEIIEKEIDIFIISTTSKFHFYYLKKIYQNFRNSKVLIEKPLFSSLEEYKEFSGFKSDFKDKVFINLPFIYADTFAEIRSSRNGELEGYKVEGGNWGLGCNLLHDLAIIHYLGGALSPLEHVEATINQVVESKRKGYSEVFGQLRFKINNVIVDLMSSKNLVGKKAVVSFSEKEWRIDFGAQTLDSSDGCKNFSIPMASSETGTLMRKIKNGDPHLPKASSFADVSVGLYSEISRSAGFSNLDQYPFS